jgi:hypothetical protein
MGRGHPGAGRGMPMGRGMYGGAGYGPTGVYAHGAAPAGYGGAGVVGGFAGRGRGGFQNGW